MQLHHRFSCLFLAILVTALTGCDDDSTTDAPAQDATRVVLDDGAIRGVAVPGGYAFRGVPYAASPTGDLRWRPPQPPLAWKDVREATEYAPSCPQPPGGGSYTTGILDEDCLYLNVYTPSSDRRGKAVLPVFVWIHGGGFTQGAGRDYEPTKLMAEGVVVVTINYRLGALGFLSHPALAAAPDGSSGNYGLMDQQASLRWVQNNIERFGGDLQNVTIAGQSAGGLAVLAHLVSQSSTGLFQKAIVQSGSFALTQLPLETAESFGKSFASQAGCEDQTAECLRALSVDDLVSKFPSAAIPGTIDGEILTESIGPALAGGRFAKVPIVNGQNHDEERLFVTIGLGLHGGSFKPLTEPVTAENYQSVIGSALGVTDERAAAIVTEYPLDQYASPTVAFSTLLSDANFGCTALQLDTWTAPATPTFAYEFDDDAAPLRIAPPLDPPVATHTSELGYLFDQPDAPVQTPLTADQEALAANMRAAWASFARSGDPSTSVTPWRTFDDTHVISFGTPQTASKHCSFWAAQ